MSRAAKWECASVHKQTFASTICVQLSFIFRRVRLSNLCDVRSVLCLFLHLPRRPTHALILPDKNLFFKKKITKQTVQSCVSVFFRFFLFQCVFVCCVSNTNALSIYAPKITMVFIFAHKILFRFFRCLSFSLLFRNPFLYATFLSIFRDASKIKITICVYA